MLVTATHHLRQEHRFLPNNQLLMAFYFHTLLHYPLITVSGLEDMTAYNILALFLIVSIVVRRKRIIKPVFVSLVVKHKQHRRINHIHLTIFIYCRTFISKQIRRK